MLPAPLKLPQADLRNILGLEPFPICRAAVLRQLDALFFYAREARRSSGAHQNPSTDPIGSPL